MLIYLWYLANGSTIQDVVPGSFGIQHRVVFYENRLLGLPIVAEEQITYAVKNRGARTVATTALTGRCAIIGAL